MVRIGGGEFPDSLQEDEYMSSKGEYTVGEMGSPKLLNCLMYKMCYYRFDELPMDASAPPGFDRARGTEIGVRAPCGCGHRATF